MLASQGPAGWGCQALGSASPARIPVLNPRSASGLRHRLSPAAVRVTCTGSCRVSNKANDGAWVAEEGYFSSTLSLADKGESGHPFLASSHSDPPWGSPCLRVEPLGSLSWLCSLMALSPW